MFRSVFFNDRINPKTDDNKSKTGNRKAEDRTQNNLPVIAKIRKKAPVNIKTQRVHNPVKEEHNKE